MIVKVKVVTHPKVNDLILTKLLRALSDPVRLKLVHMLAAERDLPCAVMCLGRPKSSMSHHFKIMIDAGLLRVDVAGNTHRNNLRIDDLETRFPGLLASILRLGDKTNEEHVKSLPVGKKCQGGSHNDSPGTSSQTELVGRTTVRFHKAGWRKA